ncbi:MAG TPA: hypothetical protein VJ986_11550, partial [Gaiellaceae bacterium]|nr:hypothetical protein [Gaiellaceae bacterium]
MATKPAVRAAGSGDGDPPEELAPLPTDIRSAPLLPTRVQARALARRAGSITALVVLDLGGLAGALYLA